MLHIGVCCKSLAIQVFKCSEEFEINGANTYKHTCEWLWCHSWELMDHPPYSRILCPGISVSPDPLRSSWLASDFHHADIKQALIFRLQTPDIGFLHTDLLALVPQWNRCLSVIGDCGGLMCTVCCPCAIYTLNGSVKFSASEFWLPNFLTLPYNHINKNII